MSVIERLKKILSNMGYYINDDEDINLVENGMDSITVFSFIINVENEFGIIISEEYISIENMKSLNGFASYIETLVN